MNKKDFQNWTGYEPEDQLVELADKIFRDCPGVTPSEVCLELAKDKQLAKSKILAGLLGEVEALKQAREDMKKKLQDMEGALLFTANDADTNTAWEKAAEVLGQAEVIRYKIDSELELTSLERVYIINHLQ